MTVYIYILVKVLSMCQFVKEFLNKYESIKSMSMSMSTVVGKLPASRFKSHGDCVFCVVALTSRSRLPYRVYVYLYVCLLRLIKNML